MSEPEFIKCRGCGISLLAPNSKKGLVTCHSCQTATFVYTAETAPPPSVIAASAAAAQDPKTVLDPLALWKTAQVFRNSF